MAANSAAEGFAEHLAACEPYAKHLRAHAAGLLSRGDLQRVDAHVADALVAVPYVQAAARTTLIDVGSGAGLPGIPLSIALPQMHVTLVDSIERKAAFLSSAVRLMGLEQRVEVLCDRIEQIARVRRAQFAIATCRALAPIPVAAEWLAPLVEVGGTVIVWSTAAAVEAAPLAELGAALGFGMPEIQAAPSALRDTGCLIIWRKEEPTAPRFPRAVGVARRRPLARISQH